MVGAASDPAKTQQNKAMCLLELQLPYWPARLADDLQFPWICKSFYCPALTTIR